MFIIIVVIVMTERQVPNILKTEKNHTSIIQGYFNKKKKRRRIFKINAT
jgi:hypothetical protein